MTYLFVIYEARQKNPYDGWKDYLLSSFIVMGIAFAYSLIIGYMAYDFFGEATITNMLNNETNLGNEIFFIPICDCCGGDAIIENADKLINKNTFVIQFSCFATFIGIFLQLMFQGKSVTETK